MPALSTIYSLGYLGLIPFAVSVFCVVFEQPLVGQPPLLVFVSYSAVILAFLSGVLWGRGIQLSSSDVTSRVLLLSNVAALLAFASLLFGEQFLLSVVLLLIGYTGLLMVEYFGDQQIFTDVDKGYLQMRVNLTSLVIVSHLIVMPYGLV